MTPEQKGPGLSERLDAFFANPSADCRSTPVLQMQRQQLLAGESSYDNAAEINEIDRVLARRASQVERERR